MKRDENEKNHRLIQESPFDVHIFFQCSGYAIAHPHTHYKFLYSQALFKITILIIYYINNPNIQYFLLYFLRVLRCGFESLELNSLYQGNHVYVL